MLDSLIEAFDDEFLFALDERFTDVAMFKFLLLIEDSRISRSSIACSLSKDAPSRPPYCYKIKSKRNYEIVLER